MNLFITGKPACGKTTLIKSLIPYLSNSRGFFTEEIRAKDKRVGFKVVTLGGKEAILAHKDFKSKRRVSGYGIDIDAFDSVIVHELKEALASGSKFVIIDELGKMELESRHFKAACLALLEKKRIIGTISVTEDPFISMVKSRNDSCIMELTRGSHSRIKEEAILAVQSATLEEVRKLEESAKGLGLEEKLLIENASSNLACAIEALNIGRKVLVVAGKGNNGADVLSCARKLHSRGYDVKVCLVASHSQGEQVLWQKSLFDKTGLNIHTISEYNLEKIKSLFSDRDFILDGILGIGIKGEVAGILRQLILTINASGKKVVACDTPSGLNPDTGEVLGVAIKADYTVTFLCPKQGFFLREGKKLCGKIIVTDIGISRQILEKVASGK